MDSRATVGAGGRQAYAGGALSLARLSGSIGIAARAVVFVPIGIFLIIAGFSYNPRGARGLDGELLLLAGHPWGVAALCVIAVALLIFALYSLIEARYRDVARGV